ncbi:hypothetical protein AAH678_29080 [Sodalis endosymbiont of Spalangia cameroni]|uniref:hypothetical protein n=1 Tax=Sodalis praecaptivus TaxID=1239307 RepID=UPI0031F7FAF1
MGDSIKENLKELIFLLRDPDTKSKQAAFNACYRQLTKAKDLASWETIVKTIKSETGIEFDSRIASNMYGRTKRKLEKKLSLSVKINEEQNSTIKDRYNTEKNKEVKLESRKIENPGDLKKLRSRTINLDDLENGD